jgi:hypothetical protein
LLARSAFKSRKTIREFQGEAEKRAVSPDMPRAEMQTAQSEQHAPTRKHRGFQLS